MHRRRWVEQMAVISALFVGIAVAGQPQESSAFSQVLEAIDRLHAQEEHAAVVAEVGRFERSRAYATADAAERAALWWRAARADMAQLELRYRDGQLEGRELRRAVEPIEEKAARAAEADPSAAEPLVWQAAATGLRAREEGRLRALGTLGEVRELFAVALERNPELPEAHLILGQLYRELPGRPLAWGNDRAAVSSGRYAVELYERERDEWEAAEAGTEDSHSIVPYHRFYLSLAESLYERDWSHEERQRRKDELAQAYREADDELTRAAHYEGTVDLPPISDRAEAQDLVREMLADLQLRRPFSLRLRLDYEHARDLEAKLAR